MALPFYLAEEYAGLLAKRTTYRKRCENCRYDLDMKGFWFVISGEEEEAFFPN